MTCLSVPIKWSWPFFSQSVSTDQFCIFYSKCILDLSSAICPGSGHYQLSLKTPSCMVFASVSHLFSAEHSQCYLPKFVFCSGSLLWLLQGFLGLTNEVWFFQKDAQSSLLVSEILPRFLSPPTICGFQEGCFLWWTTRDIWEWVTSSNGCRHSISSLHSICAHGDQYPGLLGWRGLPGCLTSVIMLDKPGSNWNKLVTLFAMNCWLLWCLLARWRIVRARSLCFSHTFISGPTTPPGFRRYLVNLCCMHSWGDGWVDDWRDKC